MKSTPHFVGHRGTYRSCVVCRLSAIVALSLHVVGQHAYAVPPAATVRTVALSGQLAPGTPSGVVYRDFNQVNFSLNDAGQVAFLGYVTYTDGAGTVDGLWSEGFGSLAPVAREGEHPPDTTEIVRYNSFASTVLNNSGQIAFAAVVNDGIHTNSQGIWSQRLGLLSLVAGSETHAPGTPLEVKFAGFGGLVLNDSGRTAFKAELGGDGVDPSNDEGIWSEGAGPLTLIARQGHQAPGMPAGVSYDVFGFPVINDYGHIAFYGFVSGNGSYNQGVWSEGSGGLALVARGGEPCPWHSERDELQRFLGPGVQQFRPNRFLGLPEWKRSKRG